MSDYNPSMMPGAPPMGSLRDAQAMLRYDANKKSVMVAYVLWFFFGWLGAHRFYLKRIASAVVMLVLCIVSLPLTIVFVGISDSPYWASGRWWTLSSSPA